MKAPRSMLSRALLLVLTAAGAACTVNQGPSPEMARQPPPATPPEPMGMNPSQALGLWQSSFGAVKIETDASQPDALMGVWLYDRTGQEVIGFFTGPLRGNVLEFRWHEPGQPQDLLGAGFLVFEPDGSRFSGTWWTHDQSRTGDWNGWRVAGAGQAAPPPNPANPSYGSQDPGQNPGQDPGQNPGAIPPPPAPY